jgi:polyhydroxybutyrate depolymerase
MRLHRLFLALAAALLVAVLSPPVLSAPVPVRSSDPAPALPDNCGTASAAGSFDLTLASAGEQRNARIHVPPAAAGTRLPLLLAFHGAGANGKFMEDYSGLSKLADRAGFLVVYPSAYGTHPFWSLNDDMPNGKQDLTFISDLLDHVEDNMCIDTSRVYATGVSNGGGFTARIGCQLTPRLTAIAPVAGGYKAIPDCHPDRTLSVLEIHGTNDGAVPYHGLPPDFRGSVPRYLQGWRRLNGCVTGSVNRHIAPATVLRVWGGCSTPGTLVAHIERYGRGHEWPGAFGASGMSASRAVWAFFRGLRSP